MNDNNIIAVIPAGEKTKKIKKDKNLAKSMSLIDIPDYDLIKKILLKF